MKMRLLVLLTLCITFSQPGRAQTTDSPGFVITKANDQTVRHVRGKDDLSRIGHRDIGRTGLGNWYSVDDEIALGKEYSGLVEADLQLLDDPLVTGYVNRIGQLLVIHSDAKVPFTIKIVDSDELNAFSLPGGFLYLNYGLILTAENEAELAGVMAHEIAHVAARHATRQMTRANILNLMALPLGFVGGGVVGQVVHAVFDVAKPMEILKFSRTFEAEADYLGLQYLYVAGYDPQAFISFLERAGVGEKGSGKWSGLFCTHPSMASRVHKSQTEVSRIFPERDSYIVNTSSFDEVKAHLLAREGTHKKGAGQKAREPILRPRAPGPGPRGD